MIDNVRELPFWGYGYDPYERYCCAIAILPVNPNATVRTNKIGTFDIILYLSSTTAQFELTQVFFFRNCFVILNGISK